MTRIKENFLDSVLLRILTDPLDFSRERRLLSKETLERYRRMTTSERASIVVQSMRENWPAMFEGSDEKVARRFELLRRQNDERNRNMLKGLARTRTDAS